MRVFVTGHRGYIGSVLVPFLEDAGHIVTGMDTDLYRACDFGVAPRGGGTIHRDIRDVTPEDLVGQDAVIHLAALSNDPLGDLDPAVTRAINYDATLGLARAAKSAGVGRFLFSSSCSNYGVSPGDDWLTEDAPLNPVTPYAVSKVESEAGLDALADEVFTPVFLRSGTAYGLSPRLRFDLVVNNLTAWAVATGEVRLKSDGSAWRPLVHVADIALAFRSALTAPRACVHREAFNVGRNADCLRILDLAALIESAVPRSRVTFSGDASPDTRTYRVDCTKIADRLGYAAQFDLARGIGELTESFIRAGVAVSDFEGHRYERVAHIKHLLREGRVTADLRPMPAMAAE
jgi:nucleoside-diphosphate-sugar epimerase